MIKLREVRKSRKMTQAELADAVRYADPTVSQMTISVLEQGELYPSEKLRDAICKALSCTEAELYDGIEAYFVPAEEKEYSMTTKVLGQLLSEKPISRHDLSKTLEISDRRARSWVQKAREEGMVICNTQDSSGYYLPSSVEDLKRQYRQNQNRAISILRQQKYIKRRLNE